MRFWPILKLSYHQTEDVSQLIKCKSFKTIEKCLGLYFYLIILFNTHQYDLPQNTRTLAGCSQWKHLAPYAKGSESKGTHNVFFFFLS